MCRTEYFDVKSYEYNPKSKIGCFLIHGFSSTTCEVRDLAKFLSENGYHTKADNLPGHASTVRDCNNTKYTEWLEFVEQGLAEMSTTCDKIFVIGMSMGGALALHLASKFPIDGVVTGATVLRFKKHFKLTYLNPFVCYFVPERDKIKQHNMISERPPLIYGYSKYPMKGVNEFRKMMPTIINELYKITCPLLIQYSKVDDTARKINVDIIRNGVSSKDVSIIEYHKVSHHIYDDKPEHEQIFADVLEFLNTYSVKET